MGSSIQDYLKKINSSITLLNCLSILVTTILLLLFVLFLYIQKENKDTVVEYREYKDGIACSSSLIYSDSRPFASINGKTYTFSWCQGGSMISLKNKIYFNSEVEAQKSGRVLSKLCQK